MSDKIPTAKEYRSWSNEDPETLMIEFAKLHVEAAIKSLTRAEYDRANEKDIDILTKRNLKHFYPLTLIK